MQSFRDLGHGAAIKQFAESLRESAGLAQSLS